MLSHTVHFRACLCLILFLLDNLFAFLLLVWLVSLLRAVDQILVCNRERGEI